MNIENYLTNEEKEIVRQAQAIMDKAMCRMISDEMGIEVEYVDEHTIKVDGEEMNEEQFANYLQNQQTTSSQLN